MAPAGHRAARPGAPAAPRAPGAPGAPQPPGALGARKPAPPTTKPKPPPPDTSGGGGGGGGDQGGGGADEGEDQDVDESNSGPTTVNDNQPETGADDSSAPTEDASSEDDASSSTDDKPYVPGAGAMVAMGSEFGDDADPFTRRLLARLKKTQEATHRRQAILEPNKGAGVQVERYTMGVIPTDTQGNPTFITAIGSTVAAITLTGSRSPDCHFRPQRVTTNAPQPGLIMISMAKVANVSYIVGGQIDAWQFNSNAWDQELNLPTLTPANSAAFQGQSVPITTLPSNIFVSTGFTTSQFQFAVSFTGPAMVTGLFAEGRLPKGLY